MDFFETVEQRQAVRAYQPRPVDPALVQQILAAVNRAPSAGNMQAYRICVVRDAGLRQELMRIAYEQAFVAEAPVLLVFCAEPARAARHGQPDAELFMVQDATVAAAYAQLAATALGLATCWVSGFDEKKAAQLLRLPSGVWPVSLMPLGYAAQTPARTTRRPLSEMACDIQA